MLLAERSELTEDRVVELLRDRRDRRHQPRWGWLLKATGLRPEASARASAKDGGLEATWRARRKLNDPVSPEPRGQLLEDPAGRYHERSEVRLALCE